MDILNNLKTYLGYGPASEAATEAESTSPSLTVGQWLTTHEKLPGQVLDDSQLLSEVAHALLADRGVHDPSPHQLHETRFGVAQALKNGTWDTFACPNVPDHLDTAPGTGCCPGNVFFERDGYSSPELQPSALTLSKPNEYRLQKGYSNGCLGQVIGGTFISGNIRSGSDFTHAYGDEAWDCYLRCWAMLDDIPRGELLNRLDLDLVTETNKLVHAPDPRLLQKLYRMVGALTRGRWDVAGRIRVGRTITQAYTFKDAEVEHLRELGIQFHPAYANNLPEGHQSGYMEYPPPETIKDSIKALIITLKDELAQADPDPIGASAKFCREFIALHPYEDSNGRTGRVLMNRILEEFGYPPAILSDADNDLTMGRDPWRQEVLEGVAHTKRYLDKTELFSVDSLLGKEKITLPGAGEGARILLDGFPFSQGTDGFLYDVTGRPYLVDGDTLQPLAQLEYFFLARYLMAMPPEAATQKLADLTAQNAKLLKDVAAGTLSPEFHVTNDLGAREADSHYTIRGDSPIIQAIADLSNVRQLDHRHLFTIKGSRGTDASSLLSKYSQADLEYWYFETALREAGNIDGANRVHSQRQILFDLAKDKISALMKPGSSSEQNPHGFQFRYEQIMYDSSPLHYTNLNEAIAAEGDDLVTIWRGDYGFSGSSGISPNHDPRQAPARKDTEEKYKRQVVPHILQELNALQRNDADSHYIAHTTDLSSLPHGASHPNATPAPPAAGHGLAAALGASTPGPSPLRPGSREGGVSLQNQTRSAERQGATDIPQNASAPLKAFELKVPKSSLLPGMVSLSPNNPAANEQDVHGVETVSPREIFNSYTTDELLEALPPSDGP
jgi:hypothetical protein